MFHLNPGIGLHKHEPGLVRPGKYQKLKGTQPQKTTTAAQGQSSLQQGLPQFRIQIGGGSHLQYFLLAPLQAALPLPQVPHLPAIPQYLNFHMAGPGQPLLHVNLIIAERGGGLRLAAGEGFRNLGGRTHYPQTPTTATGYSFDHHGATLRQPGKKCLRLGLGHAVIHPLQHRHLTFPGQGPGPGFVAKLAQIVRSGANEYQPRVPARLSKATVFTEESIARMDAIAGLGPGRRRRHLIRISSPTSKRCSAPGSLRTVKRTFQAALAGDTLRQSPPPAHWAPGSPPP